MITIENVLKISLKSNIFNEFDLDFINSIQSNNQISESEINTLYIMLEKYSPELNSLNINYKDIIPIYKNSEQIPSPSPKNTTTDVNIDATYYNFIMPFGKYSKKSFGEIIEIGKLSYIKWLAREIDDPTLKKAAQCVLQNKPIVIDHSPVKLDLILDTIIIKSSFEDKEKCKSLSNRLWNQDEKQWESPVSIFSEILTTFPNAIISDQFQSHIDSVSELTSKSTAITTSKTFDLKNFGHSNTLLPYQFAGLDFIEHTNGRCMLADEMGLGKTAQSLAYIQNHPELRPIIIVSPASLKINWLNECSKWLDTSDTISIIGTGKPHSLLTDIIIINYENLSKWKSIIKKYNPQIIIFDESHYLKNSKSNRTKVATELSSLIPHRISLTGTPILARPSELYSQLHIIDPKKYSYENYGFWNFAKRYCDPQHNGYGYNFNGASNTSELAEKLKTIMLRRTKLQVLPELPNKRVSTTILPISNRSEYNIAEKDLIQYLESQNKDISGALNAEQLVRIEYLKKLTAQGKLKASMEWIQSFIDSNTKLVIFATHKDIITQLYSKFESNAVKFDGSSSQKQKEDAVTSFQNDPTTLLFIGNIKAAGVGINLTASSNVAFIELEWSPEIMNQAIDRSHRIGSEHHNSINIHYLLAENTMDSKLLSIIENKRIIIDEVLEKTSESFDLL